MFNFIRSIFLSKEQEAEEDEEVSTKLASLTIEVNTDGTMNILCDWPDFHADNAESLKSISHYYALAIHAVCNGYLEQDIIDTLKYYDKDNVFNALFAHNTLIELNNAEKLSKWKKEDGDKPIISPLDVFNSSD